MICRKVFFLAGLTLCVILQSFCQTVTSARNGSWNDPSTWDSNTVPDLSNASLVSILHDVHLGAGESHSYSLDIGGTLRIDDGAMLYVHSIDGVNGDVHVSGSLLVNGTLASGDGVRYQTTARNTFFGSAGVFRMKGGPRSYIPIALWDEHSTLIVEGFGSSGYVALAYSDGWRQSFGNVTFDCPSQSTFVDLNGHLRDIRGNFIVRNTNSNALRLSATQRSFISIGKDFRIEGPSEVWFNTTGDSTRVFVGGNFDYRSTSVGPTYLATRGRTYLRVGGQMLWSSPGALRFCSGSADSTGVRRATLELHGGLAISSGTMICPSPGRGSIVFAGAEDQTVSIPQNAMSGNFNYVVERESVVDVGLSRTNGSGNFYVKGHLKLGSPSIDGALHPISGNINTSQRFFYPGSTIEYNGVDTQTIGAHHPSDGGVNVECRNPAGVIMQTPMTVKDFTASHAVHMNGNAISIHGDVTFAEGTLRTPGRFSFAGASMQVASFNGNEIPVLELTKNAGTHVRLSSTLGVSERVSILSENTTLQSDGHLVCLSRNDNTDGTAAVSPIPAGSSIEGNVIVQRHMQGEGRIYRYMASPVENETVAGLKDDFPVTGIFADPSTGAGLNTTAPSLFYFDDGDAQSGWVPFPSQGAAADNVLVPGRGYAAFIRRDKKSTTVNFVGRLNQGSVGIPVSYNAAAPESLRGWNLIGNPYASAINWSIEEGWSRSEGISRTFAIRDNAAGTFHYSDGEIGDFSPPNIASGQSFWIHAAEPDPSVVIHEAAKVQYGGEFFRERENNTLDFISIRVSGGGMKDHAFVRIRKNAKRKFDHFDAKKMNNETLSLWTISTDAIPLAINAVDSMSCEQEIPLGLAIRDVSRTEVFTLSISVSGSFEGSEISVMDKYTDSLAVADGYVFAVSPSSLADITNRFTLIIRPRPYTEALQLRPIQCGDSVAYVEISSGRHASYWATTTDSADPIMNIMEDNKAVIRIPLGKKEREVVVRTRNFCRHITLDTFLLQSRPLPERPNVVSASRCPAGDIVLEVVPSSEDVIIYDERGGPISFREENSRLRLRDIHAGEIALQLKSRDGCVSRKKRLSIEDVDDRILSVVMKNGLLQSSMAGWWWRDGFLISEEIGDTISPSGEGRYVISTTYKGCEISASYDVEESSVGVSLSPVPFRDQLKVYSIREDLVQLSLMSIDGRVRGRYDLRGASSIIETSDIPDGVYIAEVVSTNAVYRLKVVKWNY